MDKVFLITVIFSLALLLRRFDLVRPSHVNLLVRYVMSVSLPCLTIMTIGAIDLSHAHFDIAIIAWLTMLLGAGFSYWSGRAIGLTGKRLRVFVLVSTFPNTAFLGYPYTFSLFGSEGLSYAIIYDQMGMFPLFITLGFFIAGGRDSLGQALRFPPFIALIVALLLNCFGLTPSGVPGNLIKGIGWTTLPLTIFILGLKVRFVALADFKGMTASLLIRMLLMPLMLFIILHLLEMKGLPYRVAVFETAMPPALVTGIISMQYGLDEDLAVSCISIGTVLSLLLFSIAMWLR